MKRPLTFGLLLYSVLMTGIALGSVARGQSQGVGYIQLDDDYTWHYVGVTTPTPEIDVTATPIPTATLTPYPTNTPRPTPTPGPSPTPLPLCYGFVTADTLHIRLGPGTSYPIYIKHPPTEEPLHKGDQVGILAIEGGWYLISHQPDLYVSAAWIKLATDAQCDFLTARLNTAVGIRTVPGAVGWEAMYPILRAKGIPYGVSPYSSLAYCVSALQQGGICVYRPGWPDCPPEMYTSEPGANARAFMAHAAGAAAALKGMTNVWIEPTNECLSTPMLDSQLLWWRDWMIAYIDEASRLGWPPLALPTLSPGNGDQAMFTIWKPALLSLRDHGGLFSVHDYTFQSQTGLCVCDQWEACRHVLQHKYMLAAGYSIDFTITEAARRSGADPPDLSDFTCWISQVRAQGYIHSVFLWIGGYHPAWAAANLDGLYASLAQQVN